VPLTPTQQLIEIRLGRPLAGFVRERLSEGAGWRRIANDVRGRTDISVSHETLRKWYGQKASDEAVA
jgi:hypothetical protein